MSLAPRIDRGVTRSKKRPNPRVASKHREFIRSLPCVKQGMSGHVCGGIVIGAHVRCGTDGGTGLKPSDRYLTPICWLGHTEQHQIGEVSWWGNTEIAVGLAEELFRHSGQLGRALRAIDRARQRMAAHG